MDAECFLNDSVELRELPCLLIWDSVRQVGSIQLVSKSGDNMRLSQSMVYDHFLDHGDGLGSCKDLKVLSSRNTVIVSRRF